MRTLLGLIDRISTIFLVIAAAALVGLIATSLYEVYARYMLQAPTLWSYDMVNLFNGALFLMGAAYAQREGIHVSIDVLSQRFPERVGASLMAVMLLVLVLPTIGMLAWEATRQTVRFYVTGRPIESAWHPLRWPFYVPLVLGLWSLWFQCLASLLRHVPAMSGRNGRRTAT